MSGSDLNCRLLIAIANWPLVRGFNRKSAIGNWQLLALTTLPRGGYVDAPRVNGLDVLG